MPQNRPHCLSTFVNFVFKTYFVFRNIILQKKCQRSDTSSDLGLPPSKNDKNTIIYINNIPVQDVNIKNDSDSDVIIVNDNMNVDRAVIVISDDNDSLTEITSDIKVIGIETDCESKDMSIDLSNEYSLNILENNIRNNSDLDKYITELEEVLNTDMKVNTHEIELGDNGANKNIFQNEVKNDLHFTLSNNKTCFDNYSKSNVIKNDLDSNFTKDVKNDIENLNVNTEFNNVNKDVTTQNNFDIGGKLTDIHKHLKLNPFSDVSKDFDISLSLCSSKRSRSDSENSDIVNKKYKRSIIKRVAIVPENSEDKITIDLARKVQTLISTAIDKASFLPLLQCHGIKDSNLVYSCHSEKSYLWLKKVIDVAIDLNVKIVDMQFEDEKYYKLKLKVNSFIEETLNKFLNRLELYNAGLVTDRWKVINRQYFRSFIVMTFWVDRDSFQYICDCNFSLFAGFDKIQFSISF